MTKLSFLSETPIEQDAVFRGQQGDHHGGGRVTGGGDRHPRHRSPHELLHARIPRGEHYTGATKPRDPVSGGTLSRVLAFGTFGSRVPSDPGFK